MGYIVEFQKLAGLRKLRETADAPIADEMFANEFAQHRRAMGHPLTLRNWEATMRRALALNAPLEEDEAYNKFDIAKVASALKPFSNLAFTPAREFAPVLFVTGPTETLESLAKIATKKLAAFEAGLVTKNQLRIAWD